MCYGWMVIWLQLDVTTVVDIFATLIMSVLSIIIAVLIYVHIFSLTDKKVLIFDGTFKEIQVCYPADYKMYMFFNNCLSIVWKLHIYDPLVIQLDNWFWRSSKKYISLRWSRIDMEFIQVKRQEYWLFCISNFGINIIKTLQQGGLFTVFNLDSQWVNNWVYIML